MPELLRMPEVAAGATHAVLSSWTVPEGGAYTASTVIATIETDKAIVDYEAEAAGMILRWLAAEGAEVAIGDPLALIAADGETVTDIDAALATLTGGSAAQPPLESVTAQTPPAPGTDPPSPATAQQAESSQGSSGAGRVFASPLARRLAKERGLDLSTIRGSGPNGRIRRRDIDQADAAEAADATGAPTAAPMAARATPAGYTDVPHTRVRKAIAARLTHSVTTAPHFYLRGSARVDRLLALRSELNADEETRVSLNDFVIKAVAVAHTIVPTANVIWTDDAIRRFDRVDIAVAVATDTGLVTPVLRGVDSLSIRQVAAATKDFATRAREGELRQNELEGGTISVSNLGMYGTEEFAAIINPPHASILAVGAAHQLPVVTDGVIEVGTVMRVTLSADHRPIDGVVAAQWMKVFVGLLEHPVKILA